MISLQFRKIQRVGENTLSVSLPRDWVESVGLKKGDVVCLQVEDTALRVIPGNFRARTTPQKSVTLDADMCTEEGVLKRMIFGNYAMGADLIKVTSSIRLSGHHLDEIREAVRTLMGVGVIEETRNHATLHCSIDVSSFPINRSLMRLYMIVSTMHMEAIEAFKSADVKMAKETKQRRAEADALFWATSRVISIAGNIPVLAKDIGIDASIDLFRYRVAVLCLQRISVWSMTIAQNVIDLELERLKLGKHLVAKVQEVSDIAHEVCEEAMRCLSTGDIMVANRAVEAYQEKQGAFEALQKALCTYAELKNRFFSVDKYFVGEKPPKPCTVAQLSLIVWSLRRIAELGSEIADAAIQAALHRDTKLCRVVMSDSG